MIPTKFDVLVTKVVDGDTFHSDPIYFDFGDFELKLKKPKFRLFGVDTPEKNEPGFEEATGYAKDTLEGQIVTVEVIGKDVFDRFLVTVYLKGQEETFNDTLLKLGFAKVYKCNVNVNCIININGGVNND